MVWSGGSQGDLAIAWERIKAFGDSGKPPANATAKFHPDVKPVLQVLDEGLQASHLGPIATLSEKPTLGFALLDQDSIPKAFLGENRRLDFSECTFPGLH